MEKPNIILIVADQLNSRHIGCYGHRLIQTPHMDRLADEGVLFNATYCQAPLCMPSRASFNTGMFPHACGVCYNPSILDGQFPTLAEKLQKSGYLTGGFGHLGGDGLERGFTEKLDLIDDPLKTAWAQEQEYVLSGGGKPGTCFGTVPLKSEQTCDSLAAEAAKTFMERAVSDSQPFFLQLCFYKPHTPCVVPEDTPFHYDPGEITLPESWSSDLQGKPSNLHATRKAIGMENISPELLQQVLAYYYENISLIDQYIGQVLETLRNTGAAEDTLIIVTADHGDFAGAFGIVGKTGHFYDSLVRVPLIISGLPNIVRKGHQVTSPISLVDLFPTILDACSSYGGCPPLNPAELALQGSSLWPYCTATDSSPRERAVFCENGGDAAISFNHCFEEALLVPLPTDPYSTGPVSHLLQGVMVRKGSMKLSVYSDGGLELYDLDKDPDELENLAACSSNYDSYHEIIHELMMEILTWQLNSPRPDLFQHPLPYHYKAFWQEAIPASYRESRRLHEERLKKEGN